MNTFDVLERRFSANYFDAGEALGREQIERLVHYAMQAPSAFNIQHTRFLAVTDSAAKGVLKEIAYGQRKVEQAAVVFVILADLRGHEWIDQITAADLAAGIYPPEVAGHVRRAVTTTYGDDIAAAHDEALRSASLAAMNLMTAATAMGLATGPMIGFDAKRLKDEFRIDERFLPAMLVAVGHAGRGNWPKKTRLSVGQVLVNDARPGQVPRFAQR